MEAYSKKLVLTITLMAISCVTHVMDELGTPQNIQALLDDAQQKVAHETSRVTEMQESLEQATQIALTLQEQIGSMPTQDLTNQSLETLFNQYAAGTLRSQYQLVHMLNRQSEQDFQIDQAAVFLDSYKQRVQAEYERIRTQADAQPDNTKLQDEHAIVSLQRDDMKQLLQQLSTQKNNAKQAVNSTDQLAQQAINQTIEVITKLKQISTQSARQPGLPEQERQALTIVTQMISSLVETEQSIKTLLDDRLYKEALQGATVAQTIQNALLPITADDIDAMEARAKQAKAAAEEIEKLIPVEEPADDEPVQDGPPTAAQQGQTAPATRQPTRQTPQGPAAPSAPAQPSVGPPGKASSNINAANSKLKGALKRLHLIKGYFNEIDAEERALVKRQAASVLKEYESEFKKLAQRIKQVQAEGGLDQAKFAPFNEFLELTNKLSGQIKNL